MLIIYGTVRVTLNWGSFRIRNTQKKNYAFHTFLTTGYTLSWLTEKPLKNKTTQIVDQMIQYSATWNFDGEGASAN